ncbi:MAG: hypothetical protein Q9214_007181, partial [Letrouitia sp. 1 TL-2023]
PTSQSRHIRGAAKTAVLARKRTSFSSLSRILVSKIINALISPLAYPPPPEPQRPGASELLISLIVLDFVNLWLVTGAITFVILAMADYEEPYDDGYLDDEGEEDGITAEDCWAVISAFFDSKGLVSQQLDSFDEFVQSTMQELIDEHSLLTLDQHAPQTQDESDPIVLRRYEIKFGQVSISRPAITEADGDTIHVIPQDTRLRNLTYSSPLYIEMTRKVSVARERSSGERENADGTIDSNLPRNAGTTLEWQTEEGGDDDQEPTNVFVGKLPIMLKSKYCALRSLPEKDLYEHSECPYDQGGYFIINGSEKVLIAQERSAANIVQVFKKSGTNTPYVAEIRSALEKGSRLIS